MTNSMLELAAWHDGFPGALAVSVFAAEPQSRLFAAELMASVGVDVHVEIMASMEGLPTGMSLTTLREIITAVSRSRVGVHLVGSVEYVDRILPRILPLRPAAVYLPWWAYNDDRARAVRGSGGAPWITVFDQCADFAVPRWPTSTAPDGVLVMLSRPGTPEELRLENLDIVAACSAQLPVAVDGGITEEVAALSIAAGARMVVVGRSLVLNPPEESPD